MPEAVEPVERADSSAQTEAEDAADGGWWCGGERAWHRESLE